MKILFLSLTPLAGMPWRTARVLNSILEEEGGWAKSLIYQPKGYGARVYPEDLVQGTAAANAARTECDMVILTAYMGEEHAQGKPFARHYSTEPFRWIERTPRPEYSTVVAQYQARFAKQLSPLPNVIPIDHPMFLPEKKDDNVVNVVYTPTSRATSGWAQKSYTDVMLAFRRLLNDEVYQSKVRLYVLENTPYETVMAARRRAHIVIDECSTGSYHSTTLEGLSCGAAVIGRIDTETQDAVSEMFESEKCFPIIQSGAKEIHRTLRMLIENPRLLRSSMKEGRKWMEKNYSERWQAEKWIKWHKRCLQSTERSLTA